MATITAETVKTLRELSGAGIMECKRALEETDGDVEKAAALLKERGQVAAAKRAGREANDGQVASYIHTGGKIGVLIEVNCETDFVARNEDFKAFVHDVAMHIAASSPLWVAREDVPEAAVAAEFEIYSAQAKASGKPENVIPKIAEGKLGKWFSEVVLLEQPFVKDADKTVDELRREVIGKIGENIEIRRFARFRVGDEVA
jgi:elongation factor Ts